jgi:4'-phosphopantetheinyl transferase
MASAAPILEEYPSILSSQEMARADAFRFADDRRRFMVSTSVLRLLCAAYSDREPHSITFRYGAFGKPELTPETKLRFNLSHSGKYAVVGFVEDSDIGVDIEHIRPIKEMETVARNFFSRREFHALHNLADASFTQAFYRCWTRKEAVIKAIGSGLSFPLDSFAVSLDDDHDARLLESEWAEGEATQWHLFSHQPATGYIVAVALRGAVHNMIVHKWENNTGLCT